MDEYWFSSCTDDCICAMHWCRTIQAPVLHDQMWEPYCFYGRAVVDLELVTLWPPWPRPVTTWSECDESIANIASNQIQFLIGCSVASSTQNVGDDHFVNLSPSWQAQQRETFRGLWGFFGRWLMRGFDRTCFNIFNHFEGRFFQWKSIQPYPASFLHRKGWCFWSGCCSCGFCNCSINNVGCPQLLPWMLPQPPLHINHLDHRDNFSNNINYAHGCPMGVPLPWNPLISSSWLFSHVSKRHSNDMSCCFYIVYIIILQWKLEACVFVETDAVLVELETSRLQDSSRLLSIFVLVAAAVLVTLAFEGGGFISSFLNFQGW